MSADASVLGGDVGSSPGVLASTDTAFSLLRRHYLFPEPDKGDPHRLSDVELKDAADLLAELGIAAATKISLGSEHLNNGTVEEAKQRDLYQLLFDTGFQKVFLLNDEAINRWVALDTMRLDPDRMARFFLTAILKPWQEWSPLFTNTLESIIEFIKDEAKSHETHSPHVLLLRDSCPELLFQQVAWLSGEPKRKASEVLDGGSGAEPAGGETERPDHLFIMTPRFLRNLDDLCVLIRAMGQSIDGVFTLAQLQAWIEHSTEDSQESCLSVAKELGCKSLVSLLFKGGVVRWRPLGTGLVCETAIQLTKESTEFFKAAENGSLTADKLDQFLERFSLQFQSNTDEGLTYGTLLMRAAKHGHVQVVRLLLERGADINYFGFKRFTALMLAVESGHKAVVSLLLSCGAAINRRNGSETALALAVWGDNEAMVNLLLDKYERLASEVPESRAAADVDRQNALFVAARSGKASMVCLLLARGAEIDYLGHLKRTALLQAAECGHVSVVAVLLDKKAKIHHVASQKKTALKLAAQNDHRGVVDVLLKKGARPDSRPASIITDAIVELTEVSAVYFQAVRDASLTPAMLGEFIGKGFSLRFRALDTNTLLGCAVKHKKKPLVRLLFGKNPYAYCRIYLARSIYEERRRLFDAAKVGNCKTMKKLFAKGWPIDAKNESYESLVEFIIALQGVSFVCRQKLLQQLFQAVPEGLEREALFVLAEMVRPPLVYEAQEWESTFVKIQKLLEDRVSNFTSTSLSGVSVLTSGGQGAGGKGAGADRKVAI